MEQKLASKEPGRNLRTRFQMFLERLNSEKITDCY
jgi:hypothetical protein